MFDCIKENVPDFDRGKLKDFVAKILNKEAYDHTGLVYGMGHAVYSLSDPRADILKTLPKNWRRKSTRKRNTRCANTCAGSRRADRRKAAHL